MTDRGRQQVADSPGSAIIGIPIGGGPSSAVAYLADAGYDTTALTTGGLEMGPCYAYALGELASFRYADTPMAPYNGVLVEGFTAIGEVCTGASIALGLTDTLLSGTASTPVALCSDKKCGDDGCGGSCGTCSGGLSCNEGVCVATQSSPPNAVTSPPPSDERDERDVAAAANDGCACRTAPRPRSDAPIVLALGALAACIARRRAR